MKSTMMICLGISLLWPFSESTGERLPLFGLGRTVFPQPVQFDFFDVRNDKNFTVVSFTNIFGMANTHPSAVDVNSNLVYFVVSELADSGSTSRVYAIDGTTGLLKHRMALPNNLLSLFNIYTVNGTLYAFGAQQLTQKIFRINAGAGSLTQLGGHTNFAGIGALAFDPVSNLVYIATLTPDFSSDRFAALNATNGAFVSIFNRTNTFSEIFTYRGALYGLSPLGGTSRLIRINTSTGAGTLIATYPTNFGTVGGSVMDHDEGRVYVSGGDSITNVIRRINVTNGVVEAVYRSSISYLAMFINPLITLPEIDEPAATIVWRTISGFPYRVQSALTPADTWVNLGNVITGRNGGYTQITFSATATNAHYRIIAKP